MTYLNKIYIVINENNLHVKYKNHLRIELLLRHLLQFESVIEFLEEYEGYKNYQKQFL